MSNRLSRDGRGRESIEYTHTTQVTIVIYPPDSRIHVLAMQTLKRRGLVG